jgi:hypothetical protein
LPPPLPPPPPPSSTNSNSNTNLMMGPNTWQRMINYPPTLLHPSPAAYLAAVSAAAAATGSAHPSSWLFHHYRLFQQQHQPLITMSPPHNHVCLPGGCLQCQRQSANISEIHHHSSAPMLLNLSPTSTSSSSSSQSPPQQQQLSLFASSKSSRHDLFHRS